MKIPTDLELLDEIYNLYYEEYESFTKKDDKRAARNYVSIDCKKIASKLEIDANIVFGRLYYHLDKKHGYTWDDGSKVHFFAFKIKDDMHCINFPLLSSILAGLRHENSRYKFTQKIAMLALLFSSISLGITVYKEIIVQKSSKTRQIELINHE